MIKNLKKYALYTLLIYLGIVFGLFVIQRSMIYFPNTAKPNIASYVVQGVGEFEVVTADDVPLTGWYRAPVTKDEVIIIFHGNASHHGTRIYKAAPYLKQGYGVLMAGYRGYGGNQGSPSEQGFYNDARAYIDKIIASGIVPENIILYGESVGTGVAVQMATEYPNVKAVILESPYTSLPDVAARTYFFIPVHLMMWDKFDSLSKLPQVKAPLMIIHGAQDRVIPLEFGKTLFETYKGTKEFMVIEDRGHNDMPDDIKSEGVLKFVGNLDG